MGFTCSDREQKTHFHGSIRFFPLCMSNMTRWEMTACKLPLTRHHERACADEQTSSSVQEYCSGFAVKMWSPKCCCFRRGCALWWSHRAELFKLTVKGHVRVCVSVYCGVSGKLENVWMLTQRQRQIEALYKVYHNTLNADELKLWPTDVHDVFS